jgi:hypothetical protein
MAARTTWDDATRGLARRLRPLYPDMSAAEFEHMIARIAEVELHGEPLSQPVVRLRTKKQRPMSARRGGRAA